MYRTSYVQCMRTRAACGQKACDLTTRAILDTSFCFKFRVFSLLVVNMDTSSTSRRSLKPSEDKTGYGAGENARRLDVRQRQPRKGKKDERNGGRETGLGGQPRLTIREENERGLNAWQRQINKSRKG